MPSIKQLEINKQPELRRGTLGKQIARRGEWATGLIRFEDDLSGAWQKYAGELPEECSEGSVVDLVGACTVHKKYGKQFKIDSVVNCLPGDYHGALQWLAEYLPWVGPERSKLLLDKFGRNIWDIIEKCPSRCTEIPGITEDRVADITRAYDQVKEQRKLVVELLNMGLPSKSARAALGMWGTQAANYIREQPYALYYQLSMQFALVDQVALRLGVARDATERIEAFCLKCLRDETIPHGHCAVPHHTLVAKVAMSTKCARDKVREIIESCKMLVVKGKWVMDWQLDEAEATVASVVGFLHNRNRGGI